MSVNFEEVKQRVSIRDVVKMLEVKYTEEDGTIRFACPSCKKGGERAIVVTPEQGIFCCFSAPKKNDKFLGGDCISLVAHVLGIPLKDSAEGIAEHFHLNDEPKEKVEAVTSLEGIDESKFNLDPKHEMVTKLGVSNDWAEHLGIGYAGKGLMGKSVGIPIRDKAGVLHGFCWMSEKEGLVFHSRFFMPFDLKE